MKPFLAVVSALLLAACGPPPSSQVDGSAATAPSEQTRLVDPAHIDEVLRGFVDSGKLVGVSALIYEQDREAYFGAFGLADREAGTPMARDTIARIYSMTKPVAGAVLMTLYDEGRFKLDDPLADYLPEYADVRVHVGEDGGGRPLLAAPERPISVYDILRHTAGFAAEADDSHVGRLYGQADPFDRDKTLARMSESLAGVPLLFQPGSQWLYGPAVDVQARLAERIAGKPFAQLLRERIFDPLRMDDTGHFVPQERRGRMAALYRHGEDGYGRVPDEEAFDEYYRQWPLTRGGTGLASTLDDYMRFARMLLDEGELDGARILEPATVGLMATDALSEGITERSWLPAKGQVSFGINLAVRRAPPADAQEASGAVGEFFWDGYANTLFWVDPKHRIVAVLFTQYVPYGQVDLHKPFRDAVYRRSPDASALAVTRRE